MQRMMILKETIVKIKHNYAHVFVSMKDELVTYSVPWKRKNTFVLVLIYKQT